VQHIGGDDDRVGDDAPDDLRGEVAVVTCRVGTIDLD